MRGTKAKMIRKLSQQLGKGIPEVQYTDRALNPRKPTRRTRFLYECSRLIYQNIKRDYKVVIPR